MDVVYRGGRRHQVPRVLVLVAQIFIQSILFSFLIAVCFFFFQNKIPLEQVPRLDKRLNFICQVKMSGCFSLWHFNLVEKGSTLCSVYMGKVWLDW